MTLLHEMIDVHWGLGGANYLDYSFNTISICLIIFINGHIKGENLPKTTKFKSPVNLHSIMCINTSCPNIAKYFEILFINWLKRNCPNKMSQYNVLQLILRSFAFQIHCDIITVYFIIKVW